MKRRVRSQGLRGFTLLEVLISLSLVCILLSGMWLLFGTGARQFYYGTSLISAMQDAMIFTEILEGDLEQMIVTPNIAAQPVAISTNGTRILFYIPEFKGEKPGVSEFCALAHPLDKPVLGVPVEYSLIPSTTPGAFYPARNGVPFRKLLLRSWRFTHLPADPLTVAASPAGAPPTIPTSATARRFQFIRLEIEAHGIFDRRRFSLVRKKELINATMMQRYGNVYPTPGLMIGLESRMKGFGKGFGAKQI